MSEADVWRRRVDAPPRVEIELDDQSRSQRTSSGTTGPWIKLQVLHLDINRMREPNHVQEAPLLASDGSNLTNVFSMLPRGTQGALVQEFAELVPAFADVAVRAGPSVGFHRLMFQDRWAEDTWYEPTQVSDGTILIFAFLLLRYQTHTVDMIAVEEPERGLHPYLLGEIVTVLRKLATGRLGRGAVQVLIATHSAELLEFAEPQEVRFVSRDKQDGSTKVEAAPVESADWPRVLREYQGSLGSIWLSGSLGGVPGT